MHGKKDTVLYKVLSHIYILNVNQHRMYILDI